MSNVGSLLRKIVMGEDGMSLINIPCTVSSIQNNLCVCSPINGDGNITEVRLVMDGDQTNFIIMPTIGSAVMVTMIDGEMGVITCYSEIDSIMIRGNQYGGLVKIADLVTKINNLENLVNNILNALKTTTIPLAPSGTYPFAPLYASLTGISPITQQSDLENANVKHG